MKRMIFIWLITFVYFVHCTDSGREQISANEILENVLTLELTFGSDESILPDEYILASPFRVMVTNNGDIVVPDESRLKVFDSTGNPKQIIGGPGEGPGEFDRFVYLYITETGFITVRNLRGGTYNLFAPDYSFIERKNITINKLLADLKERNGWSQALYNSIYSYSPEEKVIFSQVWKDQDKNRAIIYLSNTESKLITEAIHYDLIRPKGPGSEQTLKGSLFMSLLPGYRVIYTDTAEDRSSENGKSYYSLHIYNLRNKNSKEIKRFYEPIAIPESVIYQKSRFGAEYDKIKSETLESIGIYPPLKNLLTDGDFIFAITYSYVESKGYFVDIFDGSTGNYLRSAYFQLEDGYVFFKNGYAYRIKRGNDIFPVVEKYRIDSRVYRK